MPSIRDTFIRPFLLLNETAENIYSAKNLIFYVNYNNYILFDDKNDDIKYEDLEKQIEVRFKDKSFFLGTNFLFIYNK